MPGRHFCRGGRIRFLYTALLPCPGRQWVRDVQTPAGDTRPLKLCVRRVYTHVFVQDADLVLVHEQERLVQDKGGWQAAYCMPHGSDAGVLAMRCAWPSPAAGAQDCPACLRTVSPSAREQTVEFDLPHKHGSQRTDPQASTSPCGSASWL